MATPGQPTKYTKDTNQQALGYIAACGENYVVLDKAVIKDGELAEEQYVKKEIKLPTVEGLALELDVHRDSLYAWAKEHEEFSDTLETLKKKQAEMLIQNGLSGDYNSTIAKLMLSANHGINEKTESESTVKVTDEAFSLDEKEALLALLNDKEGS